MKMSPANSPIMLSIGALSKETGVPVATLRTWERRYGFPESQRLPSGHRRYPLDVSDRVRLIAQALDAGHRAASVVPLSIQDLQHLAQRRQQVTRTASHESTVERWIQMGSDGDHHNLTLALDRRWNDVGARAFVEEHAAPFIQEIGERWANGTLGIHHEHFISAVVSGFLSNKWRNASRGMVGKPVVLACLPGEQHVLGLHLVAILVVQGGFPVHFTGADTPSAQVAEAATEQDAQAVGVSISPSAPPKTTLQHLKTLQTHLKGRTLVVGGTSEVEAPAGAVRVHTFQELHDWIATLR